MVILRVRGIDLFGWAGVTLSSAFGARIVNVGVLLLVIFLVREGSSAAIEHYLEAIDETGARVGPGRSSSSKSGGSSIDS